MGSKRFLLSNGLGDLIREQSKSSKRIVDLFCGSGAIAWFAASQTELPVLAVDLQQFSSVLALSVIGRTRSLDIERLESRWLSRVESTRKASKLWATASSVKLTLESLPQVVDDARTMCSMNSSVGPTWNAYGGHYFSPVQALTIDYMLYCLPDSEPERTVCHAAIISAASRCAAAPGHTAQPFQPTSTAGRFLLEAWERDPIYYARQALRDICPRFAGMVGESRVGDALEVAASLEASDLVVVDPPYSGVQYSRFYHVLETIAGTESVKVSGRGRYPSTEERPRSDFSMKSRSKQALRALLTSLSATGCTVIFTFPLGASSNGLSGDQVVEVASEFFQIEKKCIHGNFSTLGGNTKKRSARMKSSELILSLRPNN